MRQDDVHLTTAALLQLCSPLLTIFYQQAWVAVHSGGTCSMLWQCGAGKAQSQSCTVDWGPASKSCWVGLGGVEQGRRNRGAVQLIGVRRRTGQTCTPGRCEAFPAFAQVSSSARSGSEFVVAPRASERAGSRPIAARSTVNIWLGGTMNRAGLDQQRVRCPLTQSYGAGVCVQQRKL